MPVVLVAGTSHVGGDSSFTVAKPPGTQAGDVLIATSAESSNSAYYITAAPAGWTALQAPLVRSNLRVQVWWKRAGASEPASYTWTAGGLALQSVAIVALRGCLPTDPPIEAWKAALAATAPAVSVTSQAGMRLCLFAATGTTNSNDIQPVSPLVEFAGTVGSNSLTTSIAGTGYTGPGTLPTGTANGTASGGTPLIAWTLALPSGNSAPNAPAWATADGQTVDVAADSVLDWDFSDPDPGDSQSQFVLDRWALDSGGARVGAAVRVTQSTPVTSYTIPGGTLAAGTQYEFKVATRDALGEPASDGDLVFSTSLFQTFVAKPGAPTITAPAAGATVNNTATLTWSTPGQDAYQVQVLDGATVVSDTGEVGGPAGASTRALVLSFPTNNTTRTIRVRRKFGGLWSDWATVTVTVSWTGPANPTGVKTPVPADGAIDLAITNPAPGAGQPAVAYNDVYYAEPGEAEERKATLIPPNSTWRHWLPASDAVYTYRIVAVATNGTTSEGTAS